MLAVPPTPIRGLLVGSVALAIALACVHTRRAEHLDHVTAVRGSGGCGTFVIFSDVEYESGLRVSVPCIELARADGLRFAVGDTHELKVDTAGHVTIGAHGRMWTTSGGIEMRALP